MAPLPLHPQLCLTPQRPHVHAWTLQPPHPRSVSVPCKQLHLGPPQTGESLSLCLLCSWRRPAISAPWIHLLQQKLIGAGMERAQEAAAPQATCISMPLSTGGPAASALSLAPGLAGSPSHSKRSTRQGNEVLSYSSRLQLREGVWGRGRGAGENLLL